MTHEKSNPTDAKSSQSLKTSPKTRRRTTLVRVALVLLVVIGTAGFLFWFNYLNMPGHSYAAESGPRQTQDQDQDKTDSSKTESQEDKATATPKADFDLPKALKAHVVHLAETLGERNLANYETLCEAADYIEEQFTELGYEPKRQTYQVRGLDCFNIEVEIEGKTSPDEIVIIGGHYDSTVGTPGANDNGSGTASMLALAKIFRESKPNKTLRFVAWTNEEPPYFQTRGKMGSWVYAERCRKQDENIVAVISLETMGYFSDEENSQHYPPPLNLMYPSTGNFIGFVSNLESNRLQRRIIKKFREHAKVPSEGASLPSATPGVGWSDHWSFWQEGYVGIMVTDTAPYRYPHYHEPTDTPDKVDYVTLGKVIEGLVFVIDDLLN